VEEQLLPVIVIPSLNIREGQCDCDCACTTGRSSSAIRPYNGSFKGLYIQAAGIKSFPLENGWLSYFVPQGSPMLTVVNESANRFLLNFSQPQSLHAAIQSFELASPLVSHKLASQLLKYRIIHNVKDAICIDQEESDTFSAWIHTTRECNLICSYCYVRKETVKMDHITGSHIIHRLAEIASSYGYKNIKLKYAGGEPTLHFPLIRTLHANAEKITARYGLSVQEVLLTNGVRLSKEMIRTLYLAGINVMVSLDGNSVTYARQRIHKNGSNTYETIISNIQEALAFGLKPRISITLTAFNLYDAKKAVQFALEHHLPFNLNFYRNVDECDSNGVSPKPDILTEAIFGIFDLINCYPNYPHSLTSILDRVRLDFPHTFPCSAGKDYMTVDIDGKLSACPMLLENPASHITAFDPLQEVRQSSLEYFDATQKSQECMECTWHTVCAGGCPLLQSTMLHRYYCQVYRAVLPKLIKIESARLIAQYNNCNV
jgi:uncharacterized protein